MHKTAFVLITRTLSKEWDLFLTKLSTVDVDVYVMEDQGDSISNNYTVLHYSEEEIRRYGYIKSCKSANNKEVIAWDKAIYHFCKKDTHDFVWFVEDDVLIPSINSFKMVEAKYSDFDLVCQKHTYFEHELEWPYWCEAARYFKKPWFMSMVCAVRLSRVMLDFTASIVEQAHEIPFIEYLWNTVASQTGVKISIAPELQEIIYRLNEADIIPELVKKGYWFHPVKNLETHVKVWGF